MLQLKIRNDLPLVRNKPENCRTDSRYLLFSIFPLVHNVIKAAFPEKTDRLLGKYSKTKDIFTKNYSIETAHYYLKKEDLKRAAFFHAIGKIFNFNRYTTTS